MINDLVSRQRAKLRQVWLIRNLQEWLDTRMAPGGLLRPIGVLVGGTAVAQLIGIVATPLLTRLYSTSAYGTLQLYSSVALFFIPISSLRYEMAIVLAADDVTAAGVAVASAICTLGTTAVVAIAVLLLRDQPWVAQRIGPIVPFLWLVPIALLFGGGYQAFTYWGLRRSRYRELARTKLTQAGTSACVQLGSGLAHVGAVGLVAGDLLGRCAGCLHLLRDVRRWDGGRFRDLAWRDVVAAARRYIRFPLVSSFSALINTGGSSLPMVLVGVYYGPEVLGWFGIADRAMGLPAMLIGQAAGQVFLRFAAPTAESSPEQVEALFRKSLRALLRVGFLPHVLIAVEGPFIFSLVFGARWHQAGVYASALSLMYFVGFASWPLMLTLNMLELQSWQLGWDVGRLLLVVGALLLAHTQHWTAMQAILAYGAAMLVGYAANILLCHRAIRWKIHQRRKRAAAAPPAPSPAPV